MYNIHTISVSDDAISYKYIVENNLCGLTYEIESNIQNIFGHHCIGIRYELDTEFRCPPCNFTEYHLWIVVKLNKDVGLRLAQNLLGIIDDLELINKQPSNVTITLEFGYEY